MVDPLLKLEISSFRRVEISSFRRVEISKQTNAKADDSNFRAFRSTEVQKSTRKFSQGLNFSKDFTEINFGSSGVGGTMKVLPA